MAMALVAPGSCAPAAENALQARQTIPNAILQCARDLTLHRSLEEGQKLYQSLCTSRFGCEFSVDPTLEGEIYWGSCGNCPFPFPAAAGRITGCVIFREPPGI
ncbi:hypothetical protein PtrSN002B_009477 [Pyrenophora tritici-repentis]|uniref:Uncharacterized protein n=2 Tax=Pyrenophora tritici-repentis TaxID=45151 RepID=A0A2W1DBT4_9PLEO|nr:uncharacterized protein PTRG_07525 [Pyrenophora tritici-repentis Pt-1C-BFP]KAA8617187.1 hypothetical protein PtrV1_10488 [Pyrenophora tritici-repentis]EDU50444.1 hypothetical protein PTRG_07525 [Pyrenophora tritici-repentis Pt-1C-BFP]KAF7446468.1 hypothetical protein A1F99_097590 [Pyrenophora tritici-repentis]KAF7567583.1 hypothetical protein PtrM4_141740 [Pyrenophora tritici-repentis]KAG9382166.1 hypothetical protein A1F94_007820 [Pyrenophora tritici-repentis]